MENAVFKKFMKEEIVQKTVIFASGLSLNIDGWRPANTKEHPYRINFYSSGMLVGYIDAEYEKIGSANLIGSEMPYTLSTPFGKVTGKYNTYGECFIFSFDNLNASLKEFKGLFEIISVGVGNRRDYLISFYANYMRKDSDSYDFIEFRRIVHSEFKIRRNRELLRMSLNFGVFELDHFYFLDSNKTDELAKIMIPLKGKRLKPRFQFLNQKLYEKETDIEFDEMDPSWLIISHLDFDIIGKEIDAHDERMKKFVDEVRKDLTFLANGLTPVCIYDRMAHLCYDGRYEFELKLSQANEVDNDLKRNRVLNKMNNK